jgi:hypothetical protein
MKRVETAQGDKAVASAFRVPPADGAVSPVTALLALRLRCARAIAHRLRGCGTRGRRCRISVCRRRSARGRNQRGHSLLADVPWRLSNHVTKTPTRVREDPNDSSLCPRKRRVYFESEAFAAQSPTNPVHACDVTDRIWPKESDRQCVWNPTAALARSSNCLF